MRRESHVRFREGVGVRFPRSTRRHCWAKRPNKRVQQSKCRMEGELRRR